MEMEIGKSLVVLRFVVAMTGPALYAVALEWAPADPSSATRERPMHGLTSAMNV